MDNKLRRSKSMRFITKGRQRVEKKLQWLKELTNHANNSNNNNNINKIVLAIITSYKTCIFFLLKTQIQKKCTIIT